MEDVVTKIKEDIENNPTLSVSEICKKYNMSYYKWRKLGIKFKNKFHPSERSLEILKKINQGESLSEIGKEYGVTRQAIYYIKKNYEGVNVLGKE